MVPALVPIALTNARCSQNTFSSMQNQRPSAAFVFFLKKPGNCVERLYLLTPETFLLLRRRK
jgi:hypothetical protein